MRIIAIDHDDERWRVAYRWMDSLFEPPRLLIDHDLRPLVEVRRSLEGDYLGGPLLVTEHQIVLLSDDPAIVLEAQTVFAGFDLVTLRHDDPRVTELRTWSASAEAVLALTYFGLDRLTLADLLQHLANRFRHWDAFNRNTQDLSIFHGKSILLQGRSMQALRDSYQALTGETLTVSAIPAKLLLAENYYQGFPLTVFDGRANGAPDSSDALLVIVSAASDPGLGASDLPSIGAIPLVVAITNTHQSQTDYAVVVDYLRVALDGVAHLAEADRLEAITRAVLASFIGKQLRRWLGSFPDPQSDDFSTLPLLLQADLRRAWQIAEWLGQS